MKRESIYAGYWYPKEKEKLEKIVSTYDAHKEKFICGIVPHAGLAFSAQFIANIVNNLSSDIKKLIIIAPSHYKYLRTDTLTFGNFTVYDTPLGLIEGYIPDIEDLFVDNDAIKKEHAIEMVLPFLANKNIKISTALINNFSDYCNIKSVVFNLLKVITPDTAIIASSDFTHYGERFEYVPYGKEINDNVLHNVKKLDERIIELLKDGRGIEAYSICKEKEATICGIAAASIVALIAKKLNLIGYDMGYNNSNKIMKVQEDSFVTYAGVGYGKG